jgi:uncharacterized protein with FMN-binding domain
LNGSRTNRQGFSSVPKRGALALVTTVLAVVLLFSFNPAVPTTALTGGGLSTDPPIVAAAPPTAAPLIAGPPAPSHNTTTGGTGSGSHSAPTPAPGQPTPTPASGNNGGSVGSNANGTFTGKAITTAYGTVQIALVVQNGKITDVQELQLPSDRRLSQQISAQAGPMLRDEVIQAQSDNINGVSGASYTSYGFYLSLQSALQQM